jgi:cardiolipin synthase
MWELVDEILDSFLPSLTVLLFVSNLMVTAGTLAWILMTKSDSTSAVAWCLFVFFVPVVGAVVFFLFGYQHVHRPLKRKRRQKQRFKQRAPAAGMTSADDTTIRQLASTDGVVAAPSAGSPGTDMARLAQTFGAFPLTHGNQIDFFHEGQGAFDAMLAAMAAARHHIHLETFIFQPDATGDMFLALLERKAREGVLVRLMYDAVGSHRLWHRKLGPLRAAGGQGCVFLPMNLFRRRLQINMRNHRKILVVDGDVGFVGGLNIGDEYLGKRRFGFWRDTHLRVRGPAVADLQRVFAEDWDFAAGENLAEGAGAARAYYQPKEAAGPYAAQIIESGPDRDVKSIREIYFAAILRARSRVWIASPYYVPDAGLRDALRLAGHLGLDVRLLCQLLPDKWIPLYAARYYWNELLAAGVKVYQYTKGMMHAKVMLVDDDWASVGTANLDNRSLHLNFEVNCLIYSSDAVAILERAFREDLGHSIRLDRNVYLKRPFAGRLLENACRLLSPVL